MLVPKAQVQSKGDAAKVLSQPNAAAALRSLWCIFGMEAACKWLYFCVNKQLLLGISMAGNLC